MQVNVSHPIIASEIAKIRQNVSLVDFRAAIEKISYLLAFPVLAKLNSTYFNGTSVLQEPFSGTKISDSVVFVPILRAGFAMLDPFLNLVPDAKVAPVGMKRNLDLSNTTYYLNLPKASPNSVAIILDPILATGNSIISTIDYLIEKGFDKIIIATILTVQEGLDKIAKKYPQVSIFFGQKDEKLNEKGYIIPGIGDAGDRFFGD
ncbi:uracil phosphoribosyltransferase [Mesomycoplasma ovipneumoniae]|uniref:Uracil phosphoribosyltransferase n=1 Tax=Mesomycoplasma ovipneumoniae TaxID=29562 RepID=A0AAJ2P4P6_9BACT|nr:uracil phosphoribosyltransferase [Mesomycoplasma ovipneumoniae]MDW2834142.1 uracil phosphoribosyltransferase [Mesomycoplasma ovipneumoniae]MDW2835785.1 uracil phosphoribosyltransferase [Mesomycoplasma ovipneumoniae]MDW2861351.1 uracil phosphoribosyltransferase [Mesomycoplasma ovipneumoniae]MDW2862045.1 uracil phosphoribosyltransferase [Mesomycoplasma ovipneumoniae]MDW2892282.1 uracil phosphoribosyltransferase [Mesomycoplasma ovipneumoniae]